MISKKVISDIVSKYSLGNNIERVKWIITDEKLIITKDLFHDNSIKLSLGKKRHIKVKLN